MNQRILDYIAEHQMDLVAPRAEEIANAIGEEPGIVAGALMGLKMVQRVTQVPGRGYRLTGAEQHRRGAL